MNGNNLSPTSSTSLFFLVFIRMGKFVCRNGPKYCNYRIPFIIVEKVSPIPQTCSAVFALKKGRRRAPRPFEKELRQTVRLRRGWGTKYYLGETHIFSLRNVAPRLMSFCLFQVFYFFLWSTSFYLFPSLSRWVIWA